MTNQERVQEQGLETTTNGGVERTSDVRVYSPPADILETAEDYVLNLDLPAADPDSLDVTFEGDVLDIRAKTRRVEPQGYALAHAEFELGDYQRSFAVNERVDADAIEARLHQGVLTIRLPKNQPATRKVTVSTR